ncbi:sigma-54-dependent Fis family transcriptional regulator [bacterium]|nr:sigma-54-dependent Fis family transcriptional regulator [bacterium]
MKLLVVDDEQSQRDSLTSFLRQIGHTADGADSGEQCLKMLARQGYDVVLTDYRMPGMTGLDVIREVRKAHPMVDVILITAFGDIDTAVQAMKEGAHDFLNKPIDINQLEVLLQHIAEHRKIVDENRQLRETLRKASFTGIISASTEMENVLNLASRVANSASNVLIRGETGVGKELVARAIHIASPRRDKPFVAVNCSALNEHLLESELFGHEKGAFTGALYSRAGRFEVANGGTLFLDEIGDLPPGVQVKLLRAIQERTVERVGSSQTVPVDVRLITATHRDLEALMAAGQFRDDLYYRLNVVTIWVPPLRERRQDIPVLANVFLAKYARENQRVIKGFTPEAMEFIVRYAYPGNVRELENAVERAVLLTRTEYLLPHDLPETIRSSMPGAAEYEGDKITLPLEASLPDTVEQLEKAMLLSALKKCDGNQTQAARMLGISEKSVRDRLKKWGVASARQENGDGE